MRPRWLSVALLSGGLLLSGCGTGSDTSPLPVSSVLPGFLTPGETVTVYGTFPAGTQLLLNSGTVPAVAIPGGLRFALPTGVLAGEHVLQLLAGSRTATAKLLVHPRLDGLALNGAELLVSGAGWGPGTQANVLLDGQLLQATVVNEGTLRAPLPRAAAYGPVTVRLTVNGQDSLHQLLTREAGAVQGRVPLAAAPDLAVQVQALPPARPVEQSRTLLVSLPSEPVRVGVLPPAFGELAGLEGFDVEPALAAVRLKLASPADAAAALTLLRAQGFNVSFDGTVSLDGSRALPAPAPKRPLSLQGTALPDPSPDQWHLARLQLSEAWTLTRGQGVTVAVVDTGILGNHPDLQGRLLPGFNFVDHNTNTTDEYGHGTHVAGLIAARGLAVGVAPDVNIVPVKVIRNAGGGSAYDVARGILYAANLLPDQPNPHPAHVINLSLGVDGTNPVIEEAVKAVLQAGVNVVVAAGNSGGALSSPATVNGVVAVSAISGPSVPYVPGYANWGEGLTVSSYGGDLGQDQDRNGAMDGILSTDVDDDGQPGYALRNGTSMATPLVAGQVALLRALGVPSKLISGHLTGTAQDLYVAGYDWKTGFGLPTGRGVTFRPERTYVLALDRQGRAVAWTAAGQDGTFLLGNLPPGEPLDLVMAVDTNGDGVVNQPGEPASWTRGLTVAGARVDAVEFPPLTPTTEGEPLSLTP